MNTFLAAQLGHTLLTIEFTLSLTLDIADNLIRVRLMNFIAPDPSNDALSVQLVLTGYKQPLYQSRRFQRAPPEDSRHQQSRK